VFDSRRAAPAGEVRGAPASAKAVAPELVEQRAAFFASQVARRAPADVKEVENDEARATPVRPIGEDA
jgi:hypothetical protein